MAWQAAAIHAADPGALVTVGSWNPLAMTDVDGLRNYWSDNCLAKAARYSTFADGTGPPRANSPQIELNGTGLDFYQFHSYPSGAGFYGESPFVGFNKSHYGFLCLN